MNDKPLASRLWDPSAPVTLCLSREHPWMRDRVKVWIHPAYTINTITPGTEYRGVVRWEPHPEGAAHPHSFEMKIEDAQQLMDHLWDLQFRPTQGAGSAGQLEAKDAHLQDMRRLVFEERIRTPCLHPHEHDRPVVSGARIDPGFLP